MNRLYAVYYGPILCVRYDKTDIPAIFLKEDSACIFAAHMNTINKGYFVKEITIKPVGKRGRPRRI